MAWLDPEDTDDVVDHIQDAVYLQYGSSIFEKVSSTEGIFDWNKRWRVTVEEITDGTT